MGLQEFEPAPGRYDVVWIQWCLLYLTDGGRGDPGGGAIREGGLPHALPAACGRVQPPAFLAVWGGGPTPGARPACKSPRARPRAPLSGRAGGPATPSLPLAHPTTPSPPHTTPPADAVALFERCKTGLVADGLIVVKENICGEGFVVDPDDHSLTRSNEYMLELFEKAGLEVVANVKQRNFPKELFDVRQYALRPRGTG